MSRDPYQFRSKGKLDIIHITNPRDPAKRKRFEALKKRIEPGENFHFESYLSGPPTPIQVNKRSKLARPEDTSTASFSEPPLFSSTQLDPSTSQSVAETPQSKPIIKPSRLSASLRIQSPLDTAKDRDSQAQIFGRKLHRSTDQLHIDASKDTGIELPTLDRSRSSPESLAESEHHSSAPLATSSTGTLVSRPPTTEPPKSKKSPTFKSIVQTIKGVFKSSDKPSQEQLDEEEQLEDFLEQSILGLREELKEPLSEHIEADSQKYHEDFDDDLLININDRYKREIELYGTKFQTERQIAEVTEQERDIEFKLKLKKRKKTNYTLLEESLIYSDDADDPRYKEVYETVQELKENIEELQKQRDKIRNERFKLEQFHFELNNRVEAIQEQHKQYREEIEEQSNAHIREAIAEQKKQIEEETKRYYRTKHKVDFQQVQQLFGDELKRKQQEIEDHWKHRFLTVVNTQGQAHTEAVNQLDLQHRQVLATLTEAHEGLLQRQTLLNQENAAARQRQLELEERNKEQENRIIFHQENERQQNLEIERLHNLQQESERRHEEALQAVAQQTVTQPSTPISVTLPTTVATFTFSSSTVTTATTTIYSSSGRFSFTKPVTTPSSQPFAFTPSGFSGTSTTSSSTGPIHTTSSSHTSGPSHHTSSSATSSTTTGPGHTSGTTTTTHKASTHKSFKKTTPTTPSVMSSAFLFMAQSKLAPYKGTTSFNEWINDYNHLCDTYSFTDQQKLANLLLHLEGPAKDCYRLAERSHGSTLTYDKAVKALKDGFRTKNSKEEFSRLLEQRKFKDGETYESFYFDILKLCYKVDSTMSQKDIVRHLIKALPPKLGKEIYDSKPRNADEVYNKLVDSAQFDSMVGRTSTVTELDVNTFVDKVAAKLQQMELNSTEEDINATRTFRGRGGRPRGNYSFNRRGNYQSNYRGNTRGYNYNRGYGRGQTYPRNNTNYQGNFRNNYRGNNYQRGNYQGNNFNGNFNRSNNFRREPYQGNNNNYQGNNYQNNNNYRGNNQQNYQGNFRGNNRGNFNYNGPRNQAQRVHYTDAPDNQPMYYQEENFSHVNATGNDNFNTRSGNYQQ